MPVSPNDLEAFARSLAESEPGEAGQRCAVSRLYYSAYHRALPLRDHLEPPSRAPKGLHDALIRRLTEAHHPDISKGTRKKIRAVGYALKRMKRDRVTADYFLDEEVGAAEVQQNFRELKRLQAKLRDAERLLLGASEDHP
ncbi:MAG: hypothetical protein ACLFSI_02660 [Halorhodospira sp.]